MDFVCYMPLYGCPYGPFFLPDTGFFGHTVFMLRVNATGDQIVRVSVVDLQKFSSSSSSFTHLNFSLLSLIILPSFLKSTLRQSFYTFRYITRRTLVVAQMYDLLAKIAAALEFAL